MEPVFRLSYPEHVVAERLQQLLKPQKDVFSVTVPVSRQNKGWDLLVYSSETARAARIQVKSSRYYLEPRAEERGFSHVFWFKNFRPNLNQADFFALFGVLPSLNDATRAGRGFSKRWEQRLMVFSRTEVDVLLPPLGQRFFYIAFHEADPHRMLCLNGRKQTLCAFSYEDVRSTHRGAAIGRFLTDGTTPASVVRPYAAAVA